MDKDKLPNCTKCWDKGYSTQMHGFESYADFIGQKNIKDKPKIYKKFCTCARGKYLEGDHNV